MNPSITPFINLIVTILIFAIAGWGLYLACKKFELPQPILWICGVLLILAILYFLATGGTFIRVVH